MNVRRGKGKNTFTIVAACVFLLLTVLYQVFAKEEVSPNQANEPVMNAVSQWKEVLEIGLNTIGDEVAGTVKWQGSWYTQLDPAEAANVLTSRLGLPQAAEGVLQGHTVFSASGSLEGLRASLNLTQLSSSEYYVVLRLEGKGAEAMTFMTEHQEMAGQSLAEEGVAVEWNAALQGTMKQSDLPKGSSLGEAMDKLENQFADELELTSVEQYEDQDTISRTYRSSHLPITVNSGGELVAFQAAVHVHSETGEQEVSLGSPLLTIEY